MNSIREVLNLEPVTYLIKIHENHKAGIMPLKDSEVKEIIMAVGEAE